MNNTDITSFPGSSFTDIFVRENGLDKKGFTKWFFYSGMEYGGQNNWWGEKRTRTRPHEGIDLRFYRDFTDNIFFIDDKAKIPAMYDGIVVKIMNDYLGKTIIIVHSFPDSDKGISLTLYGHTSPVNNLEIGQSVKAGDIMATLAPSKGLTAPAAHLHLSLAWSPTPVPYDILDWTNIGNPAIVHLIDPLLVIDASM